MVTRARRVGIGVAGIATAVGLVVSPLPVVLGASRLAALALLVVGAWIIVVRVGLVDLGTGAAVGVGAYAGGVLAATAGFAMPVGLATGLAAGAAVGALSGAVGGRVGGRLGALTSLAIGAATVAILRAWPGAGGRAGFHAVPLLTGSDRGDLVALLTLLALAVGVAALFSRSRSASAAAVAVGAPVPAAALGRHPARDAAIAGAVGGAVLGLGGAASAAVTGSVTPDAHGLTLSAGLALAALLGGERAAGAVVGALLLWGPGVLWPLAPVIGDTSPLLTTGVVALALLVVRPHGLLPPAGSPLTLPEHGRAPTPATRGAGDDQPVLVATGIPLVASRRVDVELFPGQTVAVVGPNGIGKSTLLARLGGQLHDGTAIRLLGGPAPAGAVARARAGVARTWQEPPRIAPTDGLRVVGHDRAARSAAAWAAGVLGDHATTPAGAQLVRLVARRPAVALLDEPAAHLPADRVAALVAGLTEQGAAVLLVEHRPEAVAIADRVIRVGDAETAGGTGEGVQ